MFAENNSPSCKSCLQAYIHCKKIPEYFFIFYDLTRLKDDNKNAAKTGVTETTRKVAVYPHPTNKNIKFWDLPGIGMYQLHGIIY